MAQSSDGPSTSARAVKDTTKLFLAHLAAGAGSVAFSAWLFRIVPETGLALWPVCLSLGQVVTVLSSFGMGDYFIRVVPDLIAIGDHDGGARVLRTGMLLNAVAAIPLCLLLWVFAEPVARLLLHQPEMAPYVRRLVVAVYFAAMRDRLAWGLNAVQDFDKLALLRVAVDVARSPLTVVFYLWTGVNGLVLSLTVVNVAASVLSVYWLRRYLLSGGGFEPPLSLLRRASPFFGVGVMSFLQGQADYLVVGALGGPLALAPYFVARRLSDILTSLDRMAVHAITPKLTERAGSHPERRPAVFRKCFEYLFLGMLPLHVAAAALAGPAMALYGGAKYHEAAPIFALLCVGGFISVVFLVYRAHVQVFAHPSHLLLLQAIGGVLSIVGMVAFVTLFGPVGAGLSLVAVGTVLVLASAALLRQSMPLEYDWRRLGWAAAGSLAMGGVIWALGVVTRLPGPLLLGAAMVVGVPVYLAVVWHQLTGEDLEVGLSALPAAVRRSRAGQYLRALVGRDD